jgi:arylsulfatase A-like enzyme
MAQEGMRLDALYAPCSVCGPSRAALMFGQHLGHCKIRGNPVWSLPASQGLGTVDVEESDRLLPEYLKQAGYATGCFGKWGLNENHETNGGHPNKHGFDEFWGFNTHNEAHFHWPDYVWHNSEKVDLGSGGRNWREKLVYGDALFTEKCVDFITTQAKAKKPFFAYLALTAPHLGNSVPQEYHEMYADKGWPHIKAGNGHYHNDEGQNEAYAGMISHLDAMAGVVRKKLENLGIAENTLVLFTSDNGQEFGKKFFNKESPFSGGKRTLNEGGIRMPSLVWWPGVVKAGSVSDQPLAFWDLMPTFCELAGTAAAKNTDGISFVPLLTGKGKQKEHEVLFWYFNEKADPIVAVRFGKWKAIRQWDKKREALGSLSLYDLSVDPAEKKDLAMQYPEMAEKAAAYMKKAWVDDSNFPQTLLVKYPKK